MTQTSFLAWIYERKLNLKENINYMDPFIMLDQKAGDFVYFGVHDLAKSYKLNGFLPDLDLQEMSAKLGQIVDADPVNQTVSIQTHRSPWYYGYKKLEDQRTRDKRKNAAEPASVKVPVKSLIDINHLMTGTQLGHNLWLVIDTTSKYQDNLMREIRKKEFERANTTQIPRPITHDPVNQASQNQFLVQGRHIVSNPQHAKSVPTLPQDDLSLDFANFDPTILSYGRCWKTHSDTKRYQYYPE